MLRPLHMPQRGGALRYWGISLSSHLHQRQVSERMAEACQEVFARQGRHADIRLCTDATAPRYADGRGDVSCRARETRQAARPRLLGWVRRVFLSQVSAARSAEPLPP